MLWQELSGSIIVSSILFAFGFKWGMVVKTELKPYFLQNSSEYYFIFTRTQFIKDHTFITALR